MDIERVYVLEDHILEFLDSVRFHLRPAVVCPVTWKESCTARKYISSESPLSSR